MSSAAQPSTTLTTETSPGAAARILDLVWPSTCLAAFLGLFAAWYLRLLEVPFAPIATALTAAIMVHFAAFWLLESETAPRTRAIVLAAVHVTGVLALGYVWFLIGGPDIPAFLVFFAFPVAAAAMTVGRWARLATVAGTLLVLGLIVLLRASELRWYFERLGLPMDAVEFLASILRTNASHLDASRSIAATTLLSSVLALASFACIGVLSGRLAEEALEFQHRLRRTVAALRSRRDISLDLLNDSPLGEALLLADNGQMLFANARYRSCRPEFPEVIQSRVTGEGGRIRCALRDEEGRLHSAVAHVHHFERDGTRIAHVSIEDRSEIRQLAAALDCLAHLVIVIDSTDVIRYVNLEARSYFPEAQPGSATACLNHPNLSEGWWRTARDTSSPRDLQIAGVRFSGVVVHRADGANGPGLSVIALSRGAEP